MLKLFLSIVMVGVLAGCATTQQSPEVNRLQLQVSQLEQKLQDREEEVDELKYELQQASSQNEGVDFSDVEEPVEERVRRPVTSYGKTEAAEDTRIIRVAASPQDVQTALKSAGYYTGAVDGKIGPKTQDAIKAFQADHNLKSDGIVGSKTWAEMKNYLQ